jgi:hypothetical protein
MSHKHAIAKRERERAVKERRARKLENRQAKAVKRRGDQGAPPHSEDASA